MVERSKRLSMEISSPVGSTLSGRWFGRLRVAERTHISDLLPLLDDDGLRKAPEPLVVSVLQEDKRHIDRALMMRDHHPNEVLVGVAARRDLHALVHACICRRHFRMEIRTGAAAIKWAGVRSVAVT